MTPALQISACSGKFMAKNIAAASRTDAREDRSSGSEWMRLVVVEGEDEEEPTGTESRSVLHADSHRDGRFAATMVAPDARRTRAVSRPRPVAVPCIRLRWGWG